MRAWILLACLTSACAWNQTPVVAPVPVHEISVGLNDGFRGVLPAIVFHQDCPHMIRTPQLSGVATQAFLDAAPSGCPILVLLEAPDVAQLRDIAAVNPPAIELGNELELPPYELTPVQYGEWIGHASAALAAVNYQGIVVLGGVYAIRPETKTAIKFGLMTCVAFSLNCKVGVHLYDASDEDLDWLRSLRWPVWVTEVGMPTNCRHEKVQEQHDWLAAQIARFSTVPMLERVFLYQRSDGPTCSDLDTFGIFNKPAWGLLH